MRNLDEWCEAYGESHQNPTNKNIHWVCVPIILFCTLGLFWSIPAPFFRGLLPEAVDPWLNFGTLLISGAMIFYLRLSLPLAGGMLLISAACLGACHWIEVTQVVSLPVFCGVLFVLAWIGQFIGHKIEGKKPSFFEDLQFLLVGPVWLLRFVYERMGLPV